MREFQDCLRRPQYILTHQYIEGNHPSPELHLSFTSDSPQIHLSFTSAGQDWTKMLSRRKLSQTAWMSYSPPDTQINGWEGKKRLIIVFANLVSLPSVICCPEIIIFSAQCTHLQQPPQFWVFWHLVFWVILFVWPIASQKHENLIVGKIIELQVCIYRDTHHQYIFLKLSSKHDAWYD